MCYDGKPKVGSRPVASKSTMMGCSVGTEQAQKKI